MRLSDGQRRLLWTIWLAVLALLMAGTDTGSLSGREFLAMVGATALTVWICRHPRGGRKVVIRSSAEVQGEFESRTNWPLVLLAIGLILGGLAAGVRIGHDWWFGLTTLGGIFEDIALFFTEWLIERLSNGTTGDVTHTKMYTLVVLLPVGAALLLFTILPLLFRGQRFCVGDEGGVSIWQEGQWEPIGENDYPVVQADGWTIDFKSSEEAAATIMLPQGRVFSRELGTRIDPAILADFFRRQLEGLGYSIEVLTPDDPQPKAWIARRGPKR